MKNIFIISGPSGAGEDSIIDGLAELLPIERTITTVTRAPRTGEHDGHPYYFVSLEIFRRKIASGEMVEYAQQYNGNFYEGKALLLSSFLHVPDLHGSIRGLLRECGLPGRHSR